MQEILLLVSDEPTARTSAALSSVGNPVRHCNYTKPAGTQMHMRSLFAVIHDCGALRKLVELKLLHTVRFKRKASA